MITIMRKNLLFLLVFLSSCNFAEDGYYTKTTTKNELVDNKPVVVSEKIETFRMSDHKRTAVLTKVFNYDDDIKIKTLTGLTKKDGLQNYLLDSIFYDKMGNDSLKKCFVFIDKQWQLTQIFIQKFDQNNKIIFYMTERPFSGMQYYKKEIYYKYNSFGKILSETEFECNQNTCDSIFKKEYIYNSENKLEKQIFYTGKKGTWKEFKTTKPESN